MVSIHVYGYTDHSQSTSLEINMFYYFHTHHTWILCVSEVVIVVIHIQWNLSLWILYKGLNRKFLCIKDSLMVPNKELHNFTNLILNLQRVFAKCPNMEIPHCTCVIILYTFVSLLYSLGKDIQSVVRS